jgi:tetratricopeptide (TPR) repeat protein
MKYCFISLLLLIALTSAAQSNTPFYGNWIKTRVTYRDGQELTDDNSLKYDYLRYSFEKPDKLWLAFAYHAKGSTFKYSFSGNTLQVENSAGFIMNHFWVEKITRDSLIMVQELNGGFDNPNCFRYYFVAEALYQKAIPLKPKDIVAVRAGDTIYRASPKIYAGFTGDKGFHDIVTEALSGLHDQAPLNNHFLATFIVNKMGEADSLHIVAGINPAYDKQFTKTFNKYKKSWIPAKYHGKAVSVQMTDETNYIPSEKFPVFQKFLALGEKAMANGEYAIAVFNFGKALNAYPSGDVYYKRALCESVLKNGEDACRDLQSAEDSGYSAATGLLAKICR